MNYLEISACFLFLIVQSYCCHRKLCLNTVGQELLNLIKVPKDPYVCVCVVSLCAAESFNWVQNIGSECSIQGLVCIHECSTESSIPMS